MGGALPIQILKEGEFIFEELKLALFGVVWRKHISPLFLKRDDAFDIPPLISKMYERLIYNQLSEYAESFVSHVLCGSRKAHSRQHALFKLLRN